jgi:hypothetical protein
MTPFAIEINHKSLYGTYEFICKAVRLIGSEIQLQLQCLEKVYFDDQSIVYRPMR